MPSLWFQASVNVLGSENQPFKLDLRANGILTVEHKSIFTTLQIVGQFETWGAIQTDPLLTLQVGFLFGAIRQ